MTRRSDAGVTLVEVLVVLVLIGVMAGVVGLSLGPAGQGDALTREADLLAARLNRAADEALLTGAAFAVVIDPERYRFDIAQGDGWVPHPLSFLGRPHDLPAGMTLVAEDAADARFAVTADLLPVSGAVLALAIRGNGTVVEKLRFDGVNARRIAP